MIKQVKKVAINTFLYIEYVILCLFYNIYNWFKPIDIREEKDLICPNCGELNKWHNISCEYCNFLFRE